VEGGEQGNKGEGLDGRREGMEGRRGRKREGNLAPQLFLKVGAYAIYMLSLLNKHVYMHSI